MLRYPTPTSPLYRSHQISAEQSRIPITPVTFTPLIIDQNPSMNSAPSPSFNGSPYAFSTLPDNGFLSSLSSSSSSAMMSQSIQYSVPRSDFNLPSAAYSLTPSPSFLSHIQPLIPCGTYPSLPAPPIESSSSFSNLKLEVATLQQTIQTIETYSQDLLQFLNMADRVKTDVLPLLAQGNQRLSQQLAHSNLRIAKKQKRLEKSEKELCEARNLITNLNEKISFLEQENRRLLATQTPPCVSSISPTLLPQFQRIKETNSDTTQTSSTHALKSNKKRIASNSKKRKSGPQNRNQTGTED